MQTETGERIVNPDYLDIIVEYSGDYSVFDQFPDATVTILNSLYAVVYIPAGLLTIDFVGKWGYSILPNCYGVISEVSLESTGIPQIRGVPNFNLRGQGVLIGIVDSGIDYMWGVLYCIQKARQLNRPLALCLGLGTSQTAHSGLSHLSNFLNIMGDFTSVGIVASLGNEGNLGRHFFGMINRGTNSIPVELNVGKNETNFSMEMWGDFTGLFSVDITSPSGEYIPRIVGGLQGERRISFVFEETVLSVNYQLIESITGYQLILFRFQNVSAGMWKFNVYAQGDITSQFHIWLPMGNFISENTYFINSNIYTTLLSPGDASVPITVTAYNPLNEALYPNASRGYTSDNRVKPEIAAPGVNYIAPALKNEFTTYTGTGVAASHTAGIVALFLEWAVVREKDISADTIVIKNYMIRGAIRKENITYPNRDWGYGILNIYNVFDIFRAT